MLPRNKCKRCGHKWIPRKDMPSIVCPNCKSPYWYKDRTNNVGGDENGKKQTRNNKQDRGRL